MPDYAASDPSRARDGEVHPVPLRSRRLGGGGGGGGGGGEVMLKRAMVK